MGTKVQHVVQFGSGGHVIEAGGESQLCSFVTFGYIGYAGSGVHSGGRSQQY